MKTFIIPTTRTFHLSKKIALNKKNFRIIYPNLNNDGKRLFPDGEIYMKIENAGKLKKKRVVVLHSGAPEPNEGLVELELILQILRDNKVNSPEVFFSYFPYGMQDDVFKTGETNIAENLIEKLVKFYNVKKIYIIDPHFGGKKWTKKYPIKVVSAMPSLIKKTKEKIGDDIVFLTPDIGSQRRTKIKGFLKKRIDSFNVNFSSKKIDIKKKDVAVVDDILETGGTLISFYDECKKLGAKKIVALITHGVLSSGVLKVNKKYFKLFLTNTVDCKKANIDISDLISNAIG